MYKYIAAAAFLASSVSAHGAVTSYVIDGVNYPGYQGFSPNGQPVIQRPWPNYNPIEGATSGCSLAAIRCNYGGSAPAARAAPVKAGGDITAVWAQWTHVPTIASLYLYKCAGDFSSCDGSGAGWFKINEAAWVSTTSGSMQDDVWVGTQIMKTGKWSSTVPANLAPGNYLIRHELIALHQANNPQFYPECAQIEVTGSGSANPPDSAKVAIPGSGFCVGNEPNLFFNIDTNPSRFTPATFKPNGPAVWNGSGGGNPVTTTQAPVTTTTTRTTTQAPITTTTTRTTTTTTQGGNPGQCTSTVTGPTQTFTVTAQAPTVTVTVGGGGNPTTTTVRTTTTTAGNGGACASRYGQCGGIGWSGPTCCSQGTCTKNGDYYSQCI